jgi:hypothetical protein
MKKILIISIIFSQIGCVTYKVEADYSTMFDVQMFLNNSIALYETGKRVTLFDGPDGDSTYFFGPCIDKEVINPTLVEDALINKNASYYITYSIDCDNPSTRCSELLGKRLRLADGANFNCKHKDSLLTKTKYTVKVEKNKEKLDFNVECHNYKIFFKKGQYIYRRVQYFDVQNNGKINLRAYFLYFN